MTERSLRFSKEDSAEIRTRLEKRFNDRTAFGCFVRPGGGEGYPRFQWKGRSYSAHRVAYAVWKEPVPPGWYVCHLCSNPQCVNPTHLRLGTPQHNSWDHQRKIKGLPRPAGFRRSLPESIQDPEGLEWPPPPVWVWVPEPIHPLLAMAFPAQFPEPKPPVTHTRNRELEKLAFPASFRDEEE